MKSVAPSAHFTNALKREKDRLARRLYAANEKIMVLEADAKTISDAIALIDEQLPVSIVEQEEDDANEAGTRE